MKVFKLFLIILTLTYTINGFCQNQKYIGFDIGPKFDFFQIYDESIYLRNPIPVNGLWGFNFGYEFKKGFVFETGIYKNTFSLTFYFKGDNGFEPNRYGGIGNFKSWQIPVNLKTRLNLYKEKINFIYTLGFIWLTNSHTGLQSYGLGKASAGLDSTNIDSVEYSCINSKISGNNILLQTGCGFEFLLFKTIYFTLTGVYYTGLNTITKLDLTYTMNNHQPYKGSVIYKGDSFNLFLGLKFPINRQIKK